MDESAPQVDDEGLRVSGARRQRGPVREQFLDGRACEEQLHVVELPICRFGQVQEELIRHEARLWLLRLLKQVHVVPEEDEARP